MKLYEVENGTWIRLVQNLRVPPAAPQLNKGEKIFFHHIDGMYSLCTPTEELDYDNALHLVAWAEVELVK